MRLPVLIWVIVYNYHILTFRRHTVQVNSADVDATMNGIHEPEASAGGKRPATSSPETGKRLCNISGSLKKWKPQIHVHCLINRNDNRGEIIKSSQMFIADSSVSLLLWIKSLTHFFRSKRRTDTKDQECCQKEQSRRGRGAETKTEGCEQRARSCYELK